MLVAGTERASRDGMSNRGVIQAAGIGRMMLAATQRERETLAAQIDDIGNDAGDRIFYPEQLVAANFVLQRHLHDSHSRAIIFNNCGGGKKGKGGLRAALKCEDAFSAS